MSNVPEIEEREEALRAAMLGGDVAALASLIDDDLVFTAPDGSVLGKEGDLAAHATGNLKLSRLDLSDQRFHEIDDMVVATTKAELEGTFLGEAMSGTFAYSRLWSRRSGQWRVVAGHGSRLG